MTLLTTHTGRVPAWKKLGLRLKKEDAPLTKKRTFDESLDHPDKQSSLDNGLRATHETSLDNALNPKKRKSVSFADDTKDEDGDANDILMKSFLFKNTGPDGFTAEEALTYETPKTHPANLDPSHKSSKTIVQAGLLVRVIQAFVKGALFGKWSILLLESQP